jgi:hypothetical protein
MRFGVYLPTFAWPDLRFDQAARVKAFARKAEDRRDDRRASPPPDRARRELHGRHYRFEHVMIEPRLPRFPELWVGGGSKIQTSLSPDKPYIAPAVLARIAGADGWLARGAGTQQMVKDDVRAIRDYVAGHGRDPATLRYGHLNFVHLVDTSDRERALRLPRPVFERVMGTHRTFENLQQSYFLGTTREIVERIRDLEDAGIQDMVLAPCDYDLEQLERFASEIVGRFGSEASA